jgi:hypothetical protein
MLVNSTVQLIGLHSSIQIIEKYKMSVVSSFCDFLKFSLKFKEQNIYRIVAENAVI